MTRQIRFWIALMMVWSASTFAQEQTHDHSVMHDHSAMAPAGDGKFNPFLISDAHGGFYSVFVERQNGNTDVYFQHAVAGKPFSSAVRVNDKPGDGTVRNENPPKVAVGPGGEIYVTWQNQRERYKGNIRFSRSLDGGKTFSPAVDLNSANSGTPIGRGFETIAVAPNGHIYIAWIDQRDKKGDDLATAEIWMTESSDRGKTFSADRKIVSNVCECCRLTLALDGEGRIFLSYRSVPATGPMFRDIAVARSDDGGKTFRSAIVNHDGWELNACPTDGASMTVDRAGRIDIVWFTAAGDMPRVFIASSTDHGSSFSKPALLDPNQKQARHAHAVAIGDGVALAAWDDYNSTPVVKWGIYNLAKGTVQVLGNEAGAVYPVVAVNGDHFAILAMRHDHPELFQTFATLTGR